MLMVDDGRVEGIGEVMKSSYTYFENAIFG